MGDGGSTQDIVKRQFVQRSLASATGPAAAFDPLNPDSVAAQQRAARSMREGLNSAFGTSTRGTELPQGGGLAGPPSGGPTGAGPGDPIITTQTGTNAVDNKTAADDKRSAQLDAAEQAAEERRKKNNANPANPKVYRF